MVKYLSDFPRLEVDLSLGTTISATLTTPGTWYEISSSDLITVCNNNFTNVDGSMTYTDTMSRKIKFMGSSAFSTDKACTLEFGVFVNGVFVENAHSKVDIVATTKLGGFSENACLDLKQGDVITIRAKSDTATTEITVSILSLLLFYV